MNTLRTSTSLLLALALAACCPDGESQQLSTRGEIELVAAGSAQITAGRITVDSGQTSVGATRSIDIRILNVGNGDLTIQDVSLSYTAPEGGDPQGPAFELDVPEMPQVVKIAQADEGQREITVSVVYTRQEEFQARRATLIITSDSRSNGTLAIELVEEPPSAVADVSPKIVDFGTVEQGGVEERFVNVTNTGTSPLICTGFILKGHPDFTLHVGDKAYPVSEITQTRVTLEQQIVVAPSSNEQLRVTFNPQTASPAQGQLTLYCNDLAGLDGHSVVLLANEDVPCILVEPRQVNFGGKIIGTKHALPVKISNCGDSELRLFSIALKESGTDFALNFAKSPIDNTVGIVPGEPFALSVNEAIEFEVEYVPDVVNPLDADNKPIPDTATVVIENDSFEGELEVPVTGVGVDVDCPVAVAIIEEGEQVVPQTTLHLKGDQSFSPGGANIDGYTWTVQSAPEGNTSQFIPAPGFANPVYNVNLAGEYVFCLSVDDDAGNVSCEDACITVIVIPDEAIHVELTWSTDGDAVIEPDEGVEGNGADMDLHFAHQFATGPGSPNPDIDGDGVGDPWFHEDFDCFWYNKNPNWGTFDPQISDDPSLDRDDFDGWGPENLNLDIPESGVTYHIGVHYWNDHGFGESLATVRVYIYGELETEVTDVPMVERDMWYVGIIPWTGDAGTTEVFVGDQGDYLITPNYTNPAFLPPF